MFVFVLYYNLSLALWDWRSNSFTPSGILWYQAWNWILNQLATELVQVETVSTMEAKSSIICRFKHWNCCLVYGYKWCGRDGTVVSCRWVSKEHFPHCFLSQDEEVDGEHPPSHPHLSCSFQTTLSPHLYICQAPLYEVGGFAWPHTLPVRYPAYLFDGLLTLGQLSNILWMKLSFNFWRDFTVSRSTSKMLFNAIVDDCIQHIHIYNKCFKDQRECLCTYLWNLE